jgi:hypothetical protein
MKGAARFQEHPMKRAHVPRISAWLKMVLLPALFVSLPPALGQTAAYGAVGVGTYDTVAQFKDLRVTINDQLVLEKTLAEGLADFDTSGGQWKIIDGTLQQSAADGKGVFVSAGDKTWTDYTVSVKARKVTGKEGFSLSFRALDSKNFACLNAGGWNNTQALTL